MELGGGDDLGELLHVGRLDVDDVEALVGDLDVPQVDAQVVGRHERLLVAVQRDRVDVIGVRVGEYALGHRFDLHAVHVLDNRYGHVANVAVDVVAHVDVRRGASGGGRRRRRREQVGLIGRAGRGGDDGALVALAYLPQLDRLVVGREQKVSHVLALQPLDLVYFLLDLERLEIVELGLVALKCAVHVVVGAHRPVAT